MTLALKSEEQLFADGMAVLKSESGITDVNPGSVAVTLNEVHSSELFQIYVQLLNIIRNFNLDTTTGEDLDNKAFEFGLTRIGAQKATGKVTIFRESTFQKVSTTIYSGLASPVVGNTKLRVNDASDPLFSTSGTLIVGRGSANEEEVTYAVAPVDFTNYWEFTVSAFTNNHGLDETVILKQGNNETILAGTVLVVPPSGTSAEITFTVNNDTSLLAGEDLVDNVDITAVEPGESGNIPIRALEGEEAFQSPPFSGARVENDARFTTGKDRETDDELRDRIKQHIQSLAKGTQTALINAIVGLVDPDTAKRVVSAQIILPSTLQDIVEIFIDDGTGFEPDFLAQGFETILTSATGGEKRLQLDNIPLLKAQVETNVSEPYDMSSGPLTLIYNVGVQSETITFNISDFTFPTAATAEEIVRAINDKASLIEARTSQVGSSVVISSREEANENIQVVGGTSNGILNFPTDAKETLFLYKSDQLLSKDGSTAFIDSGTVAPFDFSVLGASPWPLTLIINGKTANPQTVSFVTGDFAIPASATAQEVVDVINAQLVGAEASVVNNNLNVRIISNTELSSGSKVRITGGTANTALGFSTVEVAGTNRDYTLNRQLGQIELEVPLTANQSITAGSLFTRAFLRTVSPETYSITIGETLIVSVDGGGDQTVTFTAIGIFTAAQMASFINAQLLGATATVREIGSQNFLELTTNSQAEGLGSIEVKSTSTATALNFALDTTISNQRPHRAFSTSGNAAPYTFVKDDLLIVVLDQDAASKTFSIPMDFAGTVTSGTSGTIFANSNFNTIFPLDDELNDFYVIMLSGTNTTSGSALTITDQGGDTFRYAFSALPTGLANFASGDHATFSGMQNIENNGSFLITAVNTGGFGYIEVTNADGIAEAGSSGTAAIGQRRQINDYVAASGTMTVSSGFTNTPAAAETFTILPSSAKNVNNFFNNTQVTTITIEGVVESVDDGTKIQISSQEEGSDGAVQVTGGSANAAFGFSTSIFAGLEAYNHFTGLVELVHKTVYGDDTDSVSFPGVGAAGIQFDIKAPTVQEISFGVDVTLKEGVSISNVKDDILTAITGYINGLGVGVDVIIEEVRSRIIQLDNITDVSLTTPTANVPIADGELAKTRDSLISIG